MSGSPATDRRPRKVVVPGSDEPAPDPMYVRDRVRAQYRIIPALQVSLNALDLWAFILPAISFVEITIVGRLIVSELVMLLMLPWLWSARDHPRIPRWFVVLWAGWLLGQIVTDIVVGSAFEDIARGWAAIVFTMTNFAAILVLASTPRRARLFALGLAVGGALGYLLNPNTYAATDPWKWAFALPVGLALAASLSGSTGARRRWRTISAFVAFGALNLLFGFRSLGGASMLTAGYLLLGALAARPKSASNGSAIRALVGLSFLALTVVGTLQLYDAAASSGLLGSAAQAKYVQQSSGALGVLVGGRPEILATTQAILDSPILGHGSWARDFNYVDLLAQRSSSLGYEIGAGSGDIGLIPAHSYLMGSWVWAGFLGGLFWLVILGIALWLLANLYSFRTELAPLLVFSTVLLLWNIVFSPYGFSGRITATYAVAVCLLGLRLLRTDHDDDPVRVSSDPARFPQPQHRGSGVRNGLARDLPPASDLPGGGA